MDTDSSRRLSDLGVRVDPLAVLVLIDEVTDA
jgi:hypothetical protein